MMHDGYCGQTFQIAVETSISPQTVTVGDTVTFTCTSVLGPAMIQWEDRDNGMLVLEMTSVMQTELAFSHTAIPCTIGISIEFISNES